ncbi:VOC family protein [Vallitalea pronyensis]|uniref:VOC family protein n=1 Tax=Vallitalea pronyensis TaxID=1348613 RepID=A0A8J8SFG4_9FIRM|nr:VOC family protein [Vallitalea pronyensis]QUI21314.1 VOC family protein [Vallitalea pronyensis]
MIIKFVTIYVKNMEMSLQFYKKLGFTEVRRIDHMEGMLMVFLKDSEEGLIELIENKHNPVSDKPIKDSVVSIGLSVKDIHQTIKTLKDNDIELHKGPIEVPSGEIIAFIKDPNGVEIEFIQGFKA